jgi:hypothetical protein
MGIRDILMLIVGYACVPLALCDASYGVQVHCWLSLMRPQTAAEAGAARGGRCR